MSTKNEREFIPQIDVANEEIERLDDQLAEANAKLASKPKANSPTATPPAAKAEHSPKLTGLARAIAGNQRAQRKS